MKQLLILSFFLTVSFSFSGCKSADGGGGLNLFTPAQDIELGKQVSKEIAGDPKTYPVLPESGNEEVYRYVRGITTKLLNTGKVNYRNEFPWEVKIINDANTLNAFCTPGGYIYVYTGLIKYLDTEDQLAGVLGHEIAHAALRHSTRQMTKIYGLAALTSIATGKSDPGMIEQIALGLISLQFSRTHETEADEHSVIYLCGTDYHADGAAGFFKKIEGKGTPPAFLSTHPDPGNRIQKIEGKAKAMGCTGTKSYKTEYDRIKRLLK